MKKSKTVDQDLESLRKPVNGGEKGADLKGSSRKKRKEIFIPNNAEQAAIAREQGPIHPMLLQIKF